MRRLIAALAFPMFILAALLFWQAWRADRGSGGSGSILSPTQITLSYAGAGVCLGMGIISLRVRHSRRAGDESERQE